MINPISLGSIRKYCRTRLFQAPDVYHILPVGMCSRLFCPSPGPVRWWIATWPVLLRLQRVLFGKRLLAVLAMTLLLFCCFVVFPIALLDHSLDTAFRHRSDCQQRRCAPAGFAWLQQRTAGRYSTVLCLITVCSGRLD